MKVEWDPNKAAINLQKHGVRFSDVESVLFDPNALSFEDTTAQGELRFITIGILRNQGIPVVACCHLPAIKACYTIVSNSLIL